MRLSCIPDILRTIRGDSDIVIIGTGTSLTVDYGAWILKARFALAPAAPIPIRGWSAEALIEGKTASPKLFEEAANLCAKSCSPISDQRLTAEYRREMVRV